jgi:hypothetical protein
VRFPGRESRAICDQVVHECFRGGLKSPRVLQTAGNETADPETHRSDLTCSGNQAKHWLASNPL